MRYTEKAEQQEPVVQPLEEPPLVLTLRGPLRERFEAYAAGFPSPEEALHELLRRVDDASEAPEPSAEAPREPLKEAAVDEDVWALLG